MFETIDRIGDDLFRMTSGDIAWLRRYAGLLRRNNQFEDVVDGVNSLTVQFDPAQIKAGDVISLLTSIASTERVEEAVELATVTLSVCFGGSAGPDIETVCETLGLSHQAFIEALCACELQVDMMGFVPGFAYIKGLPKNFMVPRLATPRQKVPAGALGIAAGQLGTYALEGPGGWPIIGRISEQLFDPNSEQPFLLTGGTFVRLKVSGE